MDNLASAQNIPFAEPLDLLQSAGDVAAERGEGDPDPALHVPDDLYLDHSSLGQFIDPALQGGPVGFDLLLQVHQLHGEMILEVQ